MTSTLMFEKKLIVALRAYFYEFEMASKGTKLLSSFFQIMNLKIESKKINDTNNFSFEVDGIEFLVEESEFGFKYSTPENQPGFNKSHWNKFSNLRSREFQCPKEMAEHFFSSWCVENVQKVRKNSYSAPFNPDRLIIHEIISCQEETIRRIQYQNSLNL